MLFGQSVYCPISKCITSFFLLPLLLNFLYVTNMIREYPSPCSLLDHVLVKGLCTKNNFVANEKFKDFGKMKRFCFFLRIQSFVKVFVSVFLKRMFFFCLLELLCKKKRQIKKVTFFSSMSMEDVLKM